MRTQDETRELWRRLTNPQTVEDYGLSLPLEDLKQCPEIWEEVSIYVPSRMMGEVPKGNVMAQKMGAGIRRLQEETILKCFGTT